MLFNLRVRAGVAPAGGEADKGLYVASLSDGADGRRAKKIWTDFCEISLGRFDRHALSPATPGARAPESLSELMELMEL
eukprot:CAMPEP_0180137436 /NCGR_PEP_ID=MMETSP0986-20121125/12207_1 /TAXON_ID=697907 /ORGANISM="non described non described, Strain CCMP2293" /LENGTH=78 /DNA_ID=CAMNT_0022078889 /DNA_START=355 /DNA_END=591 /DNA_ORIENTATION=-